MVAAVVGVMRMIMRRRKMWNERRENVNDDGDDKDIGD